VKAGDVGVDLDDCQRIETESSGRVNSYGDRVNIIFFLAFTNKNEFFSEKVQAC
jgi:hypothetical protein